MRVYLHSSTWPFELPSSPTSTSPANTFLQSLGAATGPASRPGWLLGGRLVSSLLLAAQGVRLASQDWSLGGGVSPSWAAGGYFRSKMAATRVLGTWSRNAVRLVSRIEWV